MAVTLLLAIDTMEGGGSGVVIVEDCDNEDDDNGVELDVGVLRMSEDCVKNEY
ncbi:hypothetical protein I5E68_20045 [Novosphingobium sp. YJ-S2-02]|uniref:Uncharacterized protein n=1 Tax=Novosphingobium aureum TaxID=2792964 RepID=A0A931HH57_9SPHN|nr:hypothetical protein [Novosphingobium aureum]